ncbi:MAG: dolichol monophosphate mannose synthase [Elusimicrobia bacterium GWC2_51_8]|nr:MAG: dolichol monophosphate mannose synthase [Elusimicrobia bacterium GWA2_51_34]OGR58613.1 MAG: dolichol monophosphate mannose synthase [Elusimicrobia bacterium GWC2_51_8]OGR87961.1 MAG: dolichol monophosphate mannose synthase [Elusimicrobia bacterium GWF2_52_66]HAF94662.1 glycosyltransferase [Elusimicrobiota bacterium]HCE99154.1 glycosyltransferase [Elusimicrobiota bacterium]
MKKVSVVTPCFNEEANVEALYRQVKEIFHKLGSYEYEHLFVDNASTDGTQSILRKLAAADSNVKVIINTRNFGHIRSPFYGLTQAGGDAVILLVSDFQDPPELINDFVREWEAGYKVVLGIKTNSGESGLMFALRKFYYNLADGLAEVKINKNNTGFGLYDREVINQLKKLEEPYPFFRGLVSELGYKAARVEYFQPARKRGITKNNFYTLYDIGMLGIINHSKVPLRLAIFSGAALAGLNLFVAFGYFVYKLVYWNSFSVGIAPVAIGLFFFSSVQLIFLGVIGEYIGAIYTQTLKRPLVIEKERINF